MRYWNRIRDPDTPVTRSRSVIQSPSNSAPSQFGQRPMFSVPGPDQTPPDEGRLNQEARLDDVKPTDESPGSEARTELTLDEARMGTVLIHVNVNVASPPTDAQIRTVFGPRSVGFVGLIWDGSGAAWLCVRGRTDFWWYEGLTKAV